MRADLPCSGARLTAIRRSAAFFPVILLLFAVTAGARQPQPLPPGPPDQPTLRIETSLVEVPVWVEDGSGAFVPGLTADDFEVYDDGVRRPVRDLLLMGMPGDGAGGRDEPDAQAPQAPGALILAFDDAHVDPGAFRRLTSAAAAFLPTLPAAQLAGVFVGGRLAGGGLMTERAPLVEALDAARPPATRLRWRRDAGDWPRLVDEAEAVLIAGDDGPTLDQAVRRACTDDPDACKKDGGSSARIELMAKARRLSADLRQTATQSLAAWRALARGLRAAPGRKAVVVLSSGFEVREQLAALRGLIEDAARADVIFYFVDALGTARAARGGDVLDRTGWTAGDSPLGSAMAGTSEDAMNAAANDTGGYVVRGRNDAGPALARIANDQRRHYVVAFEPEGPMTGEWRRLRVVGRRGLRVRARQGYWATPSPSPTTAAAPGSAAPPAPETGGGAPAAATPAPTPDASLPVSGPPAAPALPAQPAEPAAALDPDAFHIRPVAADHVAALASSSGSGTGSAEAETAAREGWDAYERGDLERARARLSDAVRLDTPRPWVFYALGFAEMAANSPKAAATAWERVRSAAPEFEPVYFDLADAYLRLGRSSDALDVLEAAERRWPGDTEVLNAMGAIHVGRGSIDAGLSCFQRALAANETDPMTHFNLGKSYELRYVRSARFVRSTRQWHRDEGARQDAIRHYQRHIALGGAMAEQARDGLRRLAWAPR
ncbi:MAG: VWA domain-containing protein [Vicinamibacterales bacterium]